MSGRGFFFFVCYLHGLAPSAINNILKLDKFMSLWSFCAIRPQCISRDLTNATDAEKKKKMFKN
jgi:hypothetical protein